MSTPCNVIRMGIYYLRNKQRGPEDERGRFTLIINNSNRVSSYSSGSGGSSSSSSSSSKSSNTGSSGRRLTARRGNVYQSM